MTRPDHPFADLRPTAWHRIKALWLHVSDRHPDAVGLALGMLGGLGIYGLGELLWAMGVGR